MGGINKLSKDFHKHEFECKCGCGYDDISMYTVDMCQKIRDEIDRPITISSGCRCEAHNKKVGGATNSQHVKGTAADLHTPWPADKLFAKVKEMYEAGKLKSLGYCQLYDWGIHIDARNPKAKNIFNG